MIVPPSSQSVFVLAALVLVALGSANAQAVKTPPSVNTIELPVEAAEAASTVDAFHAALKAGETAKASNLLIDEALVFEAGGAERSKAAYSAKHLAADAVFEKTAEETLLNRRGGAVGPMAWIASEWRVRVKTRDRIVDRLTTESMILRRAPDGWRIIHIHWSSRAATGANAIR